jgi:hypothetical protein
MQKGPQMDWISAGTATAGTSIIKVKGQDSKYPKEILPTYMPKMAKTLNPEYVNQRYL